MNKFTFEGVVERYKAQLVAKFFSQWEGTDYTNTFTLVAKMNFSRVILSLAWEVHQIDVKSDFLHGDLIQDIYMKQPLGFEKDDGFLSIEEITV
jgi:hypothetical protein